MLRLPEARRPSRAATDVQDVSRLGEPEGRARPMRSNHSHKKGRGAVLLLPARRAREHDACGHTLFTTAERPPAPIETAPLLFFTPLLPDFPILPERLAMDCLSPRKRTAASDEPRSELVPLYVEPPVTSRSRALSIVPVREEEGEGGEGVVWGAVWVGALEGGM